MCLFLLNKKISAVFSAIYGGCFPVCPVFSFTPRISFFCSRKKADSISTDVLADEITFAESADAKDWDINGEKVKIGVKRV